MNKIDERKSTATITVKKDGNILANTGIKIRQTNHGFLFGCGAFDFVNKAKLKSDETANPAAVKKYKEVKVFKEKYVAESLNGEKVMEFKI